MPEDYHKYDTHQKREFWKIHVEQWQHGSLSQRAYCRKQALNVSHFYYWRRRILDQQGTGSVSFLPVAMPENFSTRQKTTAVRIHAPNGFTIELDKPHEPQDVREILSMVAAL